MSLACNDIDPPEDCINNVNSYPIEDKINKYCSPHCRCEPYCMCGPNCKCGLTSYIIDDNNIIEENDLI